MAIITINPQDTHSENSISYGDNYNITMNMDVSIKMDSLYHGPNSHYSMTIMKGDVAWRREFGEDEYASGEDEAYLVALPTVIAAHKLNSKVYTLSEGDLIEMGGSTWKIVDDNRFAKPKVIKV